MLVANEAMLIEDESLRHGIVTQIPTHLAFQFISTVFIDIAKARQPGAGICALILVAKPVDRCDVTGRPSRHLRMLLAAGNAPAGEHIEDTYCTDQILVAD